MASLSGRAFAANWSMLRSSRLTSSTLSCTAGGSKPLDRAYRLKEGGSRSDPQGPVVLVEVFQQMGHLTLKRDMLRAPRLLYRAHLKKVSINSER